MQPVDPFEAPGAVDELGEDETFVALAASRIRRVLVFYAILYGFSAASAALTQRWSAAVFASCPLVLQSVFFFVARSAPKRSPQLAYASAGLYLLLIGAASVMNPARVVSGVTSLGVVLSIFAIHEGRRLGAIIR
jgi:hypothetical protein